MFWKLIQRPLVYYRKQVLLLFFTLLVFASILTAFVTLCWDLKQKMESQLKSVGANFAIFPSGDSSDFSLALREQTVSQVVQHLPSSSLQGLLENLYSVVRLKSASSHQEFVSVLTGINFFTSSRRTSSAPSLNPLLSWWSMKGTWPRNSHEGVLGQRLSEELHISEPGSSLLVQVENTEHILRITGIITTGASEDYQLFVHLKTAQEWLHKLGQASLIQGRIEGDSLYLSKLAQRLEEQFPGLTARPLYQFTQAEAILYSRLKTIFLPILTVLALLSFLISSSLFSSSLLEREKEMALLLVLGAPLHHMVRILFGELFLVGLGTGLTGYGLGFYGARFFERLLLSTSLTFSWKPFFLIFGFLMALLLLSCLFPLYRLKHTQPALLLKQE